MRYSVTAWADATEPVSVRSRDDLDTTFLTVGGQFAPDREDALCLKGTREDRAAFLRRLVAVATAEAERLVPPVDDEPDGAPCCPDPGCTGRAPGQPCTFPGYVEGN